MAICTKCGERLWPGATNCFKCGTPTGAAAQGNAVEVSKVKFGDDVYEGDLVDGLPHGKGKMTYKDDSVYEGNFVTSKDKITTDDGQVYEGTFVNGKLYGKGKYSNNFGVAYEGDFVNGKFFGKGKVVYIDGTVYEGDFDSNYSHGKGKRTYTNGKVEEGDWEWGNFIGKVTSPTSGNVDVQNSAVPAAPVQTSYSPKDTKAVGDISVLIVAGSSLIRNLLGKIIENTPGMVVADKAMNGKFALDKISRVNPDIILLDKEMPEMDGIEFLKERSKRGIKIPVVLLLPNTSGNENINEALSLGISDFIRKPTGSAYESIQDALVGMIFKYGGAYRGGQ